MSLHATFRRGFVWGELLTVGWERWTSIVDRGVKFAGVPEPVRHWKQCFDLTAVHAETTFVRGKVRILSSRQEGRSKKKLNIKIIYYPT